jgi:hypothetical protein
LLNVLERLQHLRDEVFANLDEARMLRLGVGRDVLAVRPLQVALDRVVFEVLALYWVLASSPPPAAAAPAVSPPAAGAASARPAVPRTATVPNRAKPMMSFFMIRVSFITRERGRWVSDNRGGSRFPKI